MFSAGHLIWMGISFVLIAAGFTAVSVLKPSLERLLKVCLCAGVLSEAVKVLSVTQILPMVGLRFEQGTGPVLAETGQFTPYMEMAHLPLELCSLMLFFMAAALAMKNGPWRRRLLTLMFVSGVIGGVLGIVFAYITADYGSIADYFSSVRVWQFFLYHSMTVTLGLCLGFGPYLQLSPDAFRETMAGIVALDLPTFYLNSVFSQPVYEGGKPVGIVYRTNFFSSYVNPLGLVLKEKQQWLVYLGIRLLAAMLLVWVLLRAAALFRRGKNDPGAQNRGPDRADALGKP